MSKKTLLEEASVRKFMKLANLSPLMSSNFITETYGAEEEMREQAEEDVELDMGAEAPPMGDMDGEEMPMDDAPMDDMEGGAAVDITPEEALSLVDAIAAAVQDVTGHAVAAQSDEAPEDMVPMDDAPMGDAPMGDAPMMDDEDDLSEAIRDEEELEEVNMVDEDAVMQETYRRVTARLAAMNREEKLVERLAEKLKKRLSQK
jgi:hypothetical protein|tara:strand:- start:275 stop:883 length:609 start_codon:yes stop_codon:yes gene_type:complete